MPFGLSKENSENIRATSIVVAIWYLIFSIPFLMSLKKKINHNIEVPSNNIKKIKDLIWDKGLNNLGKFLIARMLYADGLNAIIVMGGIFAVGVFKLEIKDLLVLSILMNIAAFIGIMIVMFADFTRADPLIAALISVYMIYTTIAIFQKSIAVLIDREIDDDLKSEIFDIVKSHNKVLGFHDVRTRQSGSSKGKFFMQMHIEVSEHVSLEESHNIADQVEENILNQFPDAEIILHVDPSNVIEEKEFVDA